MIPSLTLLLGSLSVSSIYTWFRIGSNVSVQAPVVQEPIPDGQFTRRIIAVGDLHGGLENMKKVLKMAGVINEADDWSGNVDFFVQTGDIIGQ